MSEKGTPKWEAIRQYLLEEFGGVQECEHCDVLAPPANSIIRSSVHIGGEQDWWYAPPGIWIVRILSEHREGKHIHQLTLNPAGRFGFRTIHFHGKNLDWRRVRNAIKDM